MYVSFLAGITQLSISKYVAKIGLQNEVSVAMFKKLGFSQVSKHPF